ncbi:restriction endonuclease [Nannocystis sp. RBIL2]|uniref:restriction endonuclease n=1 Tax=Nannocystis sp. RBIL2 TaxID=2996788 RepID=UPI002270A914|nr:restriction endonuclease [Nannocystis sp. RBIL2]MCY1067941.1 restriction endonuclease [Nannocystis sp. RBIL2]
MTPRIFISYSGRDATVAKLIGDRLTGEGMTVCEARSVTAGVDRASQIALEIRRGDLIIAILCEDSPNVMFELGFAVGAGRSVLIATSLAEVIPTELGTLPCVRITPESQEDLVEAVHRVLARTRKKPSRERFEFSSSHDELSTVFSDPSYFETLEIRRFETLVTDVFRSKGFSVQAPSERDDLGFDFILELSGVPGRVAVQVKKGVRQRLISVDHVRQLMASVRFARAASGILVSSSDFTASAVGLADEASPRITLLPLERLLEESDPRALIGFGKFDRTAEELLTKLERLTDEAMSDYRHPELTGKSDVQHASSVAEAVRELQERARKLLEKAEPEGGMLDLINSIDIRYASRFQEIIHAATRNGVPHSELLRRFGNR